MRGISIILVVLTLVSGCSESPSSPTENLNSHTPELFFALEHALTEAIVQDRFSPPVASRIYAYCNLTAQQVVVQCSKEQGAFSEKLNGFKPTLANNQDTVNQGLVLIMAFVSVANELVYRDHILDSISTNLIQNLGEIDGSVKKSSNDLAQSISNNILERARSDGYAETRTMPRYTPKKGEDKWQPTPPQYTDALEPHWATIKPFTLDSAGQFYIPFRFEYSTDTASDFYNVITKEVYDSVNNLNDEYLMIARFWDCNPFLTKQTGHLTYHVRQLTPGGHWMGIAESVCKQEKLNLKETADVFARVAVAMADGFICAWHCKYKTDFIRPETYINRYMDAEWRPVLESPHFPEYTSAHSVVSAAAAYVLTQKFGKSYTFTDSSEVPYGLNAREFNSFFQASDEASLSRVLGGIHFRPAIEVGMEQGRMVGAHAMDKLNEETY